MSKWLTHRRLADGIVHCAGTGSATYQIFFRLPIPNPNPIPNPKPNPITDPNPNPNCKINKKKRHRNEIEHRVISKSRFLRDGGGFIKGL